ncbi:MAG: hypothetical protein AAFO82_00630 [Bacteroidota bacterium]
MIIRKLHTIYSYNRKALFVLLAITLLWSCSRENFDIEETVREEIVPEVTYINSLTEQMSIAPEGNIINLGCFSIQTPFSIVDKNEDQYTINDEGEFNSLFGNTNNSIIDFVYPIMIEYKDGEVRTIEGGADLGNAFASCVPTGGWTYDAFPAYGINFENSCYELEFPITIKQLDNTSITVEDRQNFNALLAEGEALFFFDFPLNLKNEAEEIITAESPSELIDLLVGCSGFDGEGLTIDEEGLEIWCYDIQYPLEVLLKDGGIETVENHESLCDLMLAGKIVNFIYPFNLLDQDNNSLKVASSYHFETALWKCNNYDYRGDEAYLLYLGTTPFRRDACYKIKYPIALVAHPYDIEAEEEKVIIKDKVQLELHLFFSEYRISEIVYPVTLKYLPNGFEADVQSLEQLMRLLEDCF